MKHLSPIVLLVALSFIVAPFAQAGEQWRCTQKNGSVAFTDRPKTPSDCDPYTKSSPRPVPPRSTAKKKAVSSRTDFRGVRASMTETEVLARAGYPNQQQRMSCPDTTDMALCSKRWIYMHGPKRKVELTFRNGRVTEIKHSPLSASSAAPR
jgi:hypothetical protein